MIIKYFVRKKFQGFFSIEQIFTSVCLRLGQQLGEGSGCEMDEVPFFFSPLNFIKNILYVRRHQKDINHITGDIHYVILGCSHSRLNVLTIHDCVILGKYKTWDPRYWAFRILWYELPMWKADLITVISEKTRMELMEKIHFGRRKIRVVNNFVDSIFLHTPRIFNSTKPVLLFIGSTENKNLNRVLAAIKGLDCRLEIVGRISDGQLSFIRDNGLEVNLSYELSKEQVYEKYAASDIVLFPSLYEGFGMLIVEANAVGRPVITSNISPMKEVAGDAAALVDPYDVNSIRAGILNVIRDDRYREGLIQKGLLNARRFDLDAVIKEYTSLYREFGGFPGILTV